MHKLSERYKASVVEKSPLLTPLTISAAGTSTGPGGAAAAVQGLGQLGAGAAATLSTANLPANMKFDPRGLGDAIMDRFASPSLGVGTPRDGAQSPPNADGPMNNATASLAGTGAEAGAKLNENLKNIGKFFRRDLGGFGGRFGSSRSPAPEDRS